MKNLRNIVNEELVSMATDKEQGEQWINHLAEQEREDDFKGSFFQNERRKQKKFILKAASITLFFVAAFYFGSKNGVFVSAEKFIKSVIFIKQPEDSESPVETNVYSDEDKHIRMEITELFNSGDGLEMGITYTALDEKGKKWIEGKRKDDVCYQEDALFYADIADPEKTGIYSTGIDYFEKSKDNSTLRINFGYWETTQSGLIFRLSDKKIRVHYEMSGEKWRDALLPIHDSLKKAVYRLVPVSDKKPEYNDYYLPKHLVISEYSFAILGENKNTIVPLKDRKRTGCYRYRGGGAWDIECTNQIVEYTDDYLAYVMLGEETPEEAWTKWGERDTDSRFFSKKREEAHALTCEGPRAYENKDTEYEDICIASGTFFDETEKVIYGNTTAFKNVPVDVEHLTKLKYYGVEYRLEKVKDAKTLEAFLGKK